LADRGMCTLDTCRVVLKVDRERYAHSNRVVCAVGRARGAHSGHVQNGLEHWKREVCTDPMGVDWSVGFQREICTLYMSAEQSTSLVETNMCIWKGPERSARLVYTCCGWVQGNL
jgi:hypothetical protein